MRIRLPVAGLATLLTLPVAAWLCRPGLWFELGLVGVAYLAAVSVFGAVVPRYPRGQTGRYDEHPGFTLLDLGAATAGLYLLGALATPLIAVYAPSVALATMLTGPWRGLFALVVALAWYGGAVALVETGALPARPPGVDLDALLPPGVTLVAGLCLVLGLLLFSCLIAYRLARAAVEGTEYRYRTAFDGALRAERVSAADEIVGQIAHAIGNPLAALIGTVQLRRESASAGPDDARILHLAERIRAVVDRMLAFSRRGHLERGPVEPEALLRSVRAQTQPLAARAGVRVRSAVGEKCPTLQVDAALMEAALVCLVENAIEASPSGSDVTLYCDAPNARTLRLSVSDCGAGIDAALRTRVLDPFFTTKADGTGLGLSIAAGIVQGHQGRLVLESGPRGGTLATVELPLGLHADPARATD